MQNSSKKKNLVSKTELEHLRQKIIDLINQNPKKAATILSLWLADSNKRAAPKKK